jgi:ribosome recycling factor
MTNKLVTDAEERMKKVVEATRRELTTIRTGKASPALLDTVRVEAYGQAVPLQQVGSISSPEARLLVVQPWDKSLIKAVTRAIQQSDLGLNRRTTAASCACPFRSSPRSAARTW